MALLADHSKDLMTVRRWTVVVCMVYWLCCVGSLLDFWIFPVFEVLVGIAFLDFVWWAMGIHILGVSLLLLDWTIVGRSESCVEELTVWSLLFGSFDIVWDFHPCRACDCQCTTVHDLGSGFLLLIYMLLVLRRFCSLHYFSIRFHQTSVDLWWLEDDGCTVYVCLHAWAEGYLLPAFLEGMLAEFVP